MLKDDRNLPRGKLDAGTDGKHAHRLHELLDQRSVKKFSAQLGDLAQCLIGGNRRRIRSAVGHRDKRIDNTGHPPEETDAVGIQPAWVAASVLALVVLGDAVENRGMDIGQPAHQIDPVRNVPLHQLKLFRRQGTRLGEQIRGHLRLAQIEKQTEGTETRQLLPGKAKMPPQRHEINRYLKAVPIGHDILLF